jgi:hypothetical protein
MKKLGWKIAGGAAAILLGVVVLMAGVLRAWARPVTFATEHAMGGHMEMTRLRPLQPGDKERAEAIAAEARKAADGYADYHKALGEGYKIFHPEIKQSVYHFTLPSNALAAGFKWDASRPSSLLYEKTADGYKLVGVMYTARYGASEEELNRRVPLSIAQWHLHTNLCIGPGGDTSELNTPGAKFGLRGSITTAAACREAGGRFMPHLFGWMVHVYPYEKDPAKVWAAGMDDDDLDMDMDMPGMSMGPKASR